MRSDLAGRGVAARGILLASMWSIAACGPGVDDSQPVDAAVVTASPGSTVGPLDSASTVETSTSLPPDSGEVPPAYDPTFTATPVSTCDTLVTGAVGYRNTTGNVANAYRKLGNTWTGRSVWAEHWGPPVGPQIVLVGQIHGNECAPAWVVNEMRSRPPMSYGLWLIPTLNPDGLASFDRRNHEGIDLNRDGGRLQSIEMNLLLDFVREVQPVLTIHLHSPLGFVGTFNGAANGGVADRVALEISRQVGWGELNSAGTNTEAEGLFAWQAIDRVLPGTPSILIELPSVSFDEAPGAPNRTQRSYGNVETARIFARVIRDVLEVEFGAK